MLGTPQLLISDDDRDFRETLRTVFERRGFDTILAADGAEAVQIVEQQSIHLVLIDFHMPKLSGLEAIRQIRKSKAALPCILISAAIDDLTREAAHSDTFSILDKPVSHRDLTATVASALVTAYGWTEVN